LAQGAQAASAALQRYIVSDTHGAALVSGKGAGAAAVAAAPTIDIPQPPAVTVPDLPVGIPAALAAVVGEPDVVDAALRSGAGEAGMETHAAAWDGAAANLSTAAQSLHQLAGNLPASWEGQDSAALSGRLQAFGTWMEDSARAAGAHAVSARQAGAHWSTALNSHPRAEAYQQTQQEYEAAAARSDAGEAARHEVELTQMKSQSGLTMHSYGQGAGGLNDKVDEPGDSPRISGDGDPHLPNKPATEYGALDDPEELEDEVLGRAVDESGDAVSESADAAAGESGQAAGQSMQSAMQSAMQMPSQLAQSAGQPFQQGAQQASQAASQMGNALGGGSPSPSSGSGLSAPRNPLGGLGSGGSPLGGLGGAGSSGGGGGGRTLPASLPEQTAPPAAAPPPSTTATPTEGAARGGAPRAGMGGMGGMTPMGMMPHGNRGGEGKELERNPDWFPDESLVKDDVEVSEPIAGQRKRVRPTET
jgi:hypothetical protein